MATYCNLWQLMASYGNLWQLMVTYGILWQLMATYSNLWQLLATYGILWQLMASYGNLWQLMTTYSNLKLGQVFKLNPKIKCNFQPFNIGTSGNTAVTSLDGRFLWQYPSKMSKFF